MRSPRFLLPLMVPATVICATAGFALGQRWIFPALAMAPAYPSMVFLLLRRRRGTAVAAMLVWAATLAATTVTLSLHHPEAAREVVWNATPYADEMFHWLETGEGAESDPSRFLVQHAWHAGVFVLLSLITGSLSSLFFGTLLVNYMAFYVARVIAASGGAPLAVLMGWHPWSAVRVVAFVILGVVLAEPLLRKLTGRGPDPAGARPWLLAAGGGLVLDALIKAFLAPWWRIWLRELTTSSIPF